VYHYEIPGSHNYQKNRQGRRWEGIAQSSRSRFGFLKLVYRECPRLARWRNGSSRQ